MDAISLTLLGYPISLLANITYDQFKSIRDRFGDLNSLERLYIKCFNEAIDEHNKHYDDYAANILKKITKEIKKDESKFLRSISQQGNIFLTSFGRKEFHIQVAKKIVQNYRIDVGNYPKLIPEVVADCFSFYVSSFYNLMNEKEGIQAILIECLKLNNILDILNKLDQQTVTKDEFDDLRKIIYTYVVASNIEYKKSIMDYDSYIKNKFKYLELRGFSPKISGKEIQMELDDIFVPLAINKQQKIVPNIWEDSSEETENTFKSVDILNHRALVILGDPGSGKSTLLKYFATQIVAFRNSEHFLKNIIPVFIRLADYSDFYNKHKKSIYEFIVNHFDNQYHHIYKESLEYSNMLILLDGLDEVVETPLRLKVTEQVLDLVARYPNNRYIVTSRIVGYQESKLGGAFVHYKLLPFRKEEIQLFSKQWYRSIASHSDKNFKQAEQQAENLYNSIFRNPSVLKLATNPLLMTIISMIHYQGKKLPSKRVELYEISTETFLEHWVQLRISDEKQLKDKTEIIEILAPIAFEIHRTKSNALIEETEFKKEFLTCFQGIHTSTSLEAAKQTCNEFIHFLRQQTGFFYEKGVDDDGNRFYGFMHLTFEEYLAAIEFVSKWSEREIDLKDYLFKPRWTEIIRLAASQIRLSNKGKAGRTQTSNFIKDILYVDDYFKDSYRPLQMACLIISDEVSINDDLQNEIFESLITVLSESKRVSLIYSISKLFSELFLSDKQAYFIAGIKHRLNIGSDLLIRNLTFILLDNFEFEVVQNLLKDFIDHPVVLHEVYGMNFYYDMRKFEFLQDAFIKFINEKEIELNNEMDYWNFRSRIMDNIEPFEYRGDQIIDFKLLVNFLKKIKNGKSNNVAMKVLCDFILGEFFRDRIKIDLLKDLQVSINHPYLTKIFEFLSQMGEKTDLQFSYKKTLFYTLNNENGMLFMTDDKFEHIFWDSGFSNIDCHQFKLFNIEDYTASIKIKYEQVDYEKFVCLLNYICGPIKNRDNLSIFINSFKSGVVMVFNFFGWEDFPFYEILSDPKQLSEIIIKNSRTYLREMPDPKFKDQIDFNNFCSLNIPPPVKLLVSLKTAQPYNDDLINQSVNYYNTCSEDLKDGVFEILFNVLNMTNKADTNLYI
jgi:energy-coupling factor transporter ATP-binding protein EcfA2